VVEAIIEDDDVALSMGREVGGLGETGNVGGGNDRIENTNVSIWTTCAKLANLCHLHRDHVDAAGQEKR
jgi:hypothetical protein